MLVRIHSEPNIGVCVALRRVAVRGWVMGLGSNRFNSLVSTGSENRFVFSDLDAKRSTAAAGLFMGVNFTYPRLELYRHGSGLQGRH